MFNKYSNSFLKDFKFDNILRKFEKNSFRNYSEGEYLYCENDLIRNIYFVLSGEIRIIKREQFIDCNLTLRKSNSGDVIGLDDALCGKCYTNSSFASKDSNVLAISKEDFIEITKRNDEFNFWVLKYLSSRNVDLVSE